MSKRPLNAGSLGKVRTNTMSMAESKDQLYEEIVNFFGVLKSLVEEKEFYEKRLDQEPNSFEKLAYTRAYFSYFEAINFRLKYLAFRASQLLHIDLSRADISILLEEKYDITNKGVVKSYEKYFPVINNMRFIDNIYAKHFNLKSRIDFKSQSWNEFTKSLQIRNRITHVKDPFDFEINKTELEVIQSSFDWYLNYIFRIASESLKWIMYNIEGEEGNELIDSLIIRVINFA